MPKSGHHPSPQKSKRHAYNEFKYRMLKLVQTYGKMTPMDVQDGLGLDKDRFSSYFYKRIVGAKLVYEAGSETLRNRRSTLWSVSKAGFDWIAAYEAQQAVVHG